jgi:hypothetical protein
MQEELRAAARATRDCARTIASDPFARPVVAAQRLGHTATGGTVTFSAEPQRPPGRVVYRGRYWVAVVSGASCASA